MTEIEFIESILREQSDYVREQYVAGSDKGVSEKAHVNDLLTEVDLAVQRALVWRIHEQYPDDAVLAEEDGLNKAPDPRPKRCWIIDPIDGTQNFVRSLFPAFGISIGFADDRQVQAGGVAFPMLDQILLAERGQGARCNGAALKVTDVSDMAKCRAEIDLSSMDTRPEIFKRFARLFAESGQLRYQGSAVVALCSIATGAADAYLHVSTNAWDIAAGILLVEEAGGKCTRLDGSPLDIYTTPQSIVASNGALHASLLDRISD